MAPQPGWQIVGGGATACANGDVDDLEFIDDGLFIVQAKQASAADFTSGQWRIEAATSGPSGLATLVALIAIRDQRRNAMTIDPDQIRAENRRLICFAARPPTPRTTVSGRTEGTHVVFPRRTRCCYRPEPECGVARRARVDAELVRWGPRSRQQAAELIGAGKVRIDGLPAVKLATAPTDTTALIVDRQ